MDAQPATPNNKTSNIADFIVYPLYEAPNVAGAGSGVNDGKLGEGRWLRPIDTPSAGHVAMARPLKRLNSKLAKSFMPELAR
jgi:hypothetical protein